jgi:hypothetical protein
MQGGAHNISPSVAVSTGAPIFIRYGPTPLLT